MDTAGVVLLPDVAGSADVDVVDGAGWDAVIIDGSGDRERGAMPFPVSEKKLALLWLSSY